MSDFLGAVFRYGGFCWALIALTLLVVAWQAIRQENIRRHKWIMITLTVAAWLFLLLYLLRYRYPDLVPHVPATFIPWIAIHGTLALIPLFGATAMVVSRWLAAQDPAHPPGHLIRHHKAWGRIIIPLWAFAHIGGVINIFLFD